MICQATIICNKESCRELDAGFLKWPRIVFWVEFPHFLLFALVWSIIRTRVTYEGSIPKRLSSKARIESKYLMHFTHSPFKKLFGEALLRKERMRKHAWSWTLTRKVNVRWMPNFRFIFEIMKAVRHQEMMYTWNECEVD